MWAPHPPGALLRSGRMADIESTRVFGARTTRVVGLRRRPLADLYHTLVTGSWWQLVAIYALVWFSAQAVFHM